MTERYAEIIKEAVSVPRMLQYYGFDTNKYGRIPCPIHQGVKPNFGYKEHYWHCFVCGAGGDVISFVQAYFGLTFREAIRKLNDDFCLGLALGEKPTLRQQRELEKKFKEILEKEEQKKAQKAELEKEYKEALSEWAMLDKVKQMSAPKTPEQEVSELYIYAIFHINEALWRLEQAEKRLSEYEHSR